MPTIDLDKFCRCSTDGRVMLPITIGEYCYATDGRIAVRLPHADAPDFPVITAHDESFYWLVVTLFDQFVPENLASIPPHETPVEKECPSCKGKGRLNWGSALPTPCAYCGGYGTRPVAVAIGNTHVSSRYLALIESLPGIRADFSNSGLDVPISFSFDGGIGLLMGMRA